MGEVVKLNPITEPGTELVGVRYWARYINLPHGTVREIYTYEGRNVELDLYYFKEREGGRIVPFAFEELTNSIKPFLLNLEKVDAYLKAEGIVGGNDA